MDNEVCLLLTQFFNLVWIVWDHLTCSEFSQVQDYLGLLVLVPLLDNFLDHCLPQEWLFLAHVSFHVSYTVLSCEALLCFNIKILPFSVLLLLAALLMELAAQTSRGISRGTSDVDEELFPIRSFHIFFSSYLYQWQLEINFRWCIPHFLFGESNLIEIHSM